MAVYNPFTLAFGQEPNNILKREFEFNQIVSDFSSPSPVSSAYLITGPRGSGKTVLLTGICSYFHKDEDWIVVELNPARGMLEALASKIYDECSFKHKFIAKTFSFSFHGVSLTLSGERPISDVETLLDAMLEQLGKHGKKVLVAIDEASSDKEMNIFAHSFQIMRRRNRPILLVMTGLYKNIHRLENEKTLTFLYRAPKVEMRPLSLMEIAASYQKMIGANEENSIAMAKLTKGYAFAYQLLGFLAFSANKKELDDDLIKQFDLRISQSSYEKIHDDMAPKEREFIKALALSTDKRFESLLESLKIQKGTYSSYRDDLIKQGIIFSPKWGKLDFTLPRFQEFVIKTLKYEDQSVNRRDNTRSTFVGGVQIGGQNKVLIQSMCNIKTSKVDEVSAQINRCAELGADIMRLSCLDMDDAKAFKAIKEKTSIPLVADIHFDYKLALAAMEAGVDAIRLNPGNIGSVEGIKLVVDMAKEKHVPIRIGVNSGSLDKSIYEGKEKIVASYLVESAKKHVKILEDLDFHDIVISLKGSDALETVEAYRLAAKTFPYPLHLGVTEAGPKDIGLIRSSAGLSPLLLEGIGDTIRISLSDDPEEEIKAAKRLLHDLGLYENHPTFISCPTCGRTQVNLIPLAKKVLDYLETNNIHKTVAVMGCIVNGPGEARHADIGAAGGNGSWVIFKKGEVIKTVKDEDVYDALIEEINRL